MIQLAGTFLPLLGVAGTIAAAAATRGARRIAVLFAVPGAVGVLCWVVTPYVLRDGNLLAAVLYIAYWVGLAGYYAILLLALLVRSHRVQKTQLS